MDAIRDGAPWALLVVPVIALQTHLVHVRMGMGLLPVRVHMFVLHVLMLMSIMRVAVLLAAMRMNVRVRLFVLAAHRYLPMLEMTLTVPPTQRPRRLQQQGESGRRKLTLPPGSGWSMVSAVVTAGVRGPARAAAADDSPGRRSQVRANTWPQRSAVPMLLA